MGSVFGFFFFCFAEAGCSEWFDSSVMHYSGFVCRDSLSHVSAALSPVTPPLSVSSGEGGGEGVCACACVGGIHFMIVTEGRGGLLGQFTRILRCVSALRRGVDTDAQKALLPYLIQYLSLESACLLCLKTVQFVSFNITYTNSFRMF